MNALPDISHEFRHMRIPIPHVIEAHLAIDRLRETRVAALNDNRPSPTEAGCVTIFAPSHAGKSTVLNWYLEKKFPDRQVPQSKVVLVTLDGESTQKAFLSQILKAFRDPLPFLGRAPEMLNRIHNYIAKCRTEALLFDEANNLRMRQANDKDATRTHNTLRGFAKLACCPIVVVGTEEAESKIWSDTQICNIDFPVELRSMSLKKRCEAEILMEYCSQLGILLKTTGLFEERSNFIAGNTLACLVEAAGGLPGRISRLVERAAYVARERGANSVDLSHLEEATNLYAIRHGFIKSNPFTIERKANEGAMRRRA